MSLRCGVAIISILVGVGTGWAAEGTDRGEGYPAVYFQESGSGANRAVFAQFLSVVPNQGNPSLTVDCALSISNVCAAPAVLEDWLLVNRPGAPRRGRIWLYLYNTDDNGKVTVYKTGPDYRVGAGLTADGELLPGHTWTVRLAEVLADAWNLPESEVQFRGYGWVLSEFDCLAGTYNNTIFGLGFTQAFEMVPAMGQGGFFGGVPVPQD